MRTNYEGYKQKALEAATEVFLNEYKNSIGIPMPKIEFALPDDDCYKIGKFYISIDETWQIHLRFGLLPLSYKDFHEEVKVLTRHEVGHYMYCPFDVITHFRMLKIVIDIYNKHYVNKYPFLNIIQLAGDLVNQTEDIIVDTVNFKRNKKETLKSEINWIKKGADFQEMPCYYKLLFLTKETLWKESLNLKENNEELLTEVKILSDKFEEGGIENKKKFLEKVEAYVHSFFKLFEQEQHNKGNGSYSGQPQVSPSKDLYPNGNQFVFQLSDKVQEALAELAQETSIQMFNQILSAAGFDSLSDKDNAKIWFEAQNANMIPIDEKTPTGSNDNYFYPTTWKIGDPIESIDMMLTFASSPIFIPGVTTKKWMKNPVFNFGSEKKQCDLLLVIDTSHSMGNVSKSSSNIYQAVQASFGVIKFFESAQSQIALIGFSDRITVNIEWTKDYDEIKDKLLISGNGGTSFPIQTIQSTLGKNKNKIVTVIITDGEIENLTQTIDYFRDYLNEGNKLFMFLQNKKKQVNAEYKSLIDIGAKIVIALTAKDMRESVLNEIYEN